MEAHAGELKSQLLEYLPAIYQEADDSGRRPFLNYFLLAFEKISLGREDGIFPEEADSRREAEATFQGLEEEIASLHLLFDPDETPEDFLTWLGSWAALSLRAGLSLLRRRRLVANIIPLYRIRGTKKYVEDLLRLHLDAASSVSDAQLPQLQVALHSTIGKDTYLGGGPPHFFRVTLVFPKEDPLEVAVQSQIARSVVDLAKPAHTYYELDVMSPRMQVGVHSTVGFDTILVD